MARWVRRVVAWTAILGFAAAIAVAVVVPRLGGGTPYAILTGSMRPGMPPGTLVVVRPAAPESLGIGDVITYQLSSGETAVVTHRIVSVAIKADGQRTFRTQGDANNVVDQKPVLPVQIRGKLWYSVPKLGYVNRYVNGDQREVATLVVALGLCAYAVAMLLGSLRDDRRRAHHVPAHRRRPIGGTP
jgi:signal peptidase